jgi:RAB protein geranylgeranyltransferase component A
VASVAGEFSAATLYHHLSGLMGIFEKRRFRNMLKFIQDLEEDNPQTWAGLDIKNQPMQVGP